MLVSVFSGKLPMIMEQKEKRQCSLISGKRTSVSKCNGYCACLEHPGYLNDKIMRQHHCVEKECDWLYSIVSIDKSTGHLPLSNMGMPLAAAIGDELKRMEQCKAAVNKFDGMKLTKLFKNEFGVWCGKYVCICSIEMEKIISEIQKFFPGEVQLIRENYDFDTAVEIIYGKLV